jgi:hypothetical protein
MHTGRTVRILQSVSQPETLVRVFAIPSVRFTYYYARSIVGNCALRAGES